MFCLLVCFWLGFILGFACVLLWLGAFLILLDVLVGLFSVLEVLF